MDSFLNDLASGKIKIVDLTHTLSPDFPILQLPEQFGQTWAFKQEVISKYDSNGPAWYWNNFQCGEHTGTHWDAPVHWISGKEHAENAVDSIDPKKFIAAAVVVNCTSEVADNEEFLLNVDHLLEWEKINGTFLPIRG